MRIAKEISALVFWIGLWIVIPAALLFPVLLWTATRTNISEERIAYFYMGGISLLFLPTALLVDFVYRPFRTRRKPRQPHQNPNDEPPTTAR
jgi:hypothetical protein